MKTITEIVSAQYNSWIYPRPVDDMVEAIANGYYEYGSPHLFQPLLWPKRRSLQNLNILIAGCGTNQASYNALSLPYANITAIDLSLASIEHSIKLVKKHNIKNVTHHHLSLLDVNKLNLKFDLIISCGVLHHLEKPEQGLIALREVLEENGIISLMLYGKYLRQGVYILQEMFKRLGCKQSQLDIDLVRDTLNHIPQTHPIQSYKKNAEDLNYDSGIVDTFLHPQDRAYSVPEILNFIEENQLQFLDWEDRCNYSTTALIDHNALIHQRLNTLPEREKWAIVELMNYHCGTHRFFIGHKVNREKIDFSNLNWKSFVPVIRPQLEVLEQGDLKNGKSAKLKRSWHEFYLHKIGIELMQQVDGNKSINEIIKQCNMNGSEIKDQQANSFFKTMQDWGHLMYWLN